MATVSSSLSSFVPTTKFRVLGFQRSSIRSEISSISISKLQAKASPSSSTHLLVSSSFRFENVKSSQMKQRIPVVFANPSQGGGGGDIVKGKAEATTEPQVELKVGMEKEVLKAGNGPKPVRGQSVTVHCTGFGKNGDLSQKFWSTKDPGQTPFTFKIGLGSVIKGWDEGVMGMQVGEVARIRCSPDYAYGSGGFPAWGILPNSVLVFEIEVLSCGSNPIQALFSKFKS